MARKKKKNASYARILDAGLRLFAQKGFHAASTREIVAAAGVTKPLLYYYFNNKEGLCCAAYEQHAEELLAALKPALKPDLAVSDALIEVAWCYFEHCGLRRDFHLLTQAFTFGPEMVPKGLDLERWSLAQRQVLESVVQRGIDQGYLKAGCSQRLVLALEGIIQAWVLRSIKGEKLPLSRLFARQIVTEILAGFRVRTGKAAEPGAVAIKS